MMQAAHSNLYIKGLPLELEQGELQQLFQIFGAIESCRIVRDMSTGLSKGYGFVKFSAVQNAVDAIKGLNGSTLGSNQVEVKFADVDIGPAPLGEHHSVAATKGWVLSRPSDSMWLRPSVVKRPCIENLYFAAVIVIVIVNAYLKQCNRISGFWNRCQDSIRQPVRQKFTSQLDRTGAKAHLCFAACQFLA